jgi:hypothetical protein
MCIVGKGRGELNVVFQNIHGFVRVCIFFLRVGFFTDLQGTFVFLYRIQDMHEYLRHGLALVRLYHDTARIPSHVRVHVRPHLHMLSFHS